MDGALGPLIGLGVAAVIALVVTLIVVGVRRERARIDRIRQWAGSTGWAVTKRPAVEWASRLPGKNRRGVSLLVSGTVNRRPVAVGDYSYTTHTSSGSGSSSTTTHRFIVTAVRLDAPYPPIEVQPRGALSRLGRSVFGDNEAATGQDEFDRQFRVKTKDPAMSRALLGPALVADHLAGRIPAWSLAGYDLLSWRSGRLSDPDEIGALAASLVRVADLLGR